MQSRTNKGHFVLESSFISLFQYPKQQHYKYTLV